MLYCGGMDKTKLNNMEQMMLKLQRVLCNKAHYGRPQSLINYLYNRIIKYNKQARKARKGSREFPNNIKRKAAK
jgi:hypothetical protein